MLPRTDRPRWIAALAKALAWVGVLALVVLASVTLVDVVGRTLFSATLPGSAEAVAMLMGITVFSGLAWTQLEDRHVVVDVVLNAIGSGPRRALQLVSLAVAVVITAALLWQMTITVIELWNKGETTMIWRLPYAPPATLMLVGLAFFVLVMVVQLARALFGRSRSPEGADHDR